MRTKNLIFVAFFCACDLPPEMAIVSPNEAVPPCGPGEQIVNGVCKRMPVCMTGSKSELCLPVCGPDTQVDDDQCVGVKNVHFLKVDIYISPDDPAVVVISYELSGPARVYYLFKQEINDPWETRGFTNDKVKKNVSKFTSFNTGAVLYWRLEARNDEDEIVDTVHGVVTMPPPPPAPACEDNPKKGAFCVLGLGRLYWPGWLVCTPAGLLECQPHCYPTEVSGNGVDDNCNGLVDEAE